MTESVSIVVLLAEKKQDQAETLSDTSILQSENNKLAGIELTVWETTMLRIIISPPRRKSVPFIKSWN